MGLSFHLNQLNLEPLWLSPHQKFGLFYTKKNEVIGAIFDKDSFRAIPVNGHFSRTQSDKEVQRFKEDLSSSLEVRFLFEAVIEVREKPTETLKRELLALQNKSEAEKALSCSGLKERIRKLWTFDFENPETWENGKRAC